MKVLVIAFGALAVIIIAVLAFFLLRDTDSQTAAAPAPTLEVSIDATVELPIAVQGAFNLGSLLVEVSYEADALEFQSVKTAALGRNALLESNEENPGRVRIGLVDPNGINGDGEIITLVFLPIQGGGSSPYTLELVEASDTDLRDLVVPLNSSEFGGFGEPFVPPALVFLP